MLNRGLRFPCFKRVLVYYVIAKKDFNPTAEIPITSLPV
nr:MAG TPA: hypothetical protein [Caudoviricetes sp.]